MFACLSGRLPPAVWDHRRAEGSNAGRQRDEHQQRAAETPDVTLRRCKCRWQLMRCHLWCHSRLDWLDLITSQSSWFKWHRCTFFLALPEMWRDHRAALGIPELHPVPGRRQIQGPWKYHVWHQGQVCGEGQSFFSQLKQSVMSVLL